MSIIIFSTQRLRLEKIEKNHLNDLHTLVSNPKVQRYFPKILNRNETKEFYDKIQNRYETDGYCFWAVMRKDDNLFIGICGILKQMVDGQIETEIGYRILDKFWGKGYGTEAAEGCIKYAKDELKKTSEFEKESIFHGLPPIKYIDCC
jgi:RimJ/RimL family protein N-acetyltransferase